MNGNPYHCAICDKPAIVDGEVQFDTVLVGEDENGAFVYSCEDCDERRLEAIDRGLEDVPSYARWTRECDIETEGINLSLTVAEVGLLVNLLTLQSERLVLGYTSRVRIDALVKVLDDALPY